MWLGDLDLEIEGETATAKPEGMFTAVKSRSIEISALLLIAAGAVIGVIAVVAGDWILVAAMVLVILAQGLTQRKARLDGAPKQ